MKLLYIINSLGTGGAEKLLVDMIPIVEKKGIQVELLILQKTNSFFEQEVVQSNIKIHYSSNSLYSPKNILLIRNLAKKFDLVHVHLFPSQYWAAFSFSKTPMIITEHCTTNKRRKKVYQLIERLTYGRYEKIISISQKADDSIQKWLGFSKNKFAMIENGINLETFNNALPITIETIPPHCKKIIMVGRFNATKDQPTAIKAMSVLQENVHLLLVGDGNLRNSCEELAKTLKVDHRVHFLGLRKDVPQLLKSCDINLISSHSEGLSISSLECLASGKPLITSDVNGLREVNKGAGLLFEDTNFHELANCVNQLLGDVDFYNLVSKRGLQRAMEYNINRTVDQHVKLYNQLVNG